MKLKSPKLQWGKTPLERYITLSKRDKLRRFFQKLVAKVNSEKD